MISFKLTEPRLLVGDTLSPNDNFFPELQELNSIISYLISFSYIPFPKVLLTLYLPAAKI